MRGEVEPGAAGPRRRHHRLGERVEFDPDDHLAPPLPRGIADLQPQPLGPARSGAVGGGEGGPLEPPAAVRPRSGAGQLLRGVRGDHRLRRAPHLGLVDRSGHLHRHQPRPRPAQHVRVDHRHRHPVQHPQGGAVQRHHPGVGQVAPEPGAEQLPPHPGRLGRRRQHGLRRLGGVPGPGQHRPGAEHRGRRGPHRVLLHLAVRQRHGPDRTGGRCAGIRSPSPTSSRSRRALLPSLELGELAQVSAGVEGERCHAVREGVRRRPGEADRGLRLVLAQSALQQPPAGRLGLGHRHGERLHGQRLHPPGRGEGDAHAVRDQRHSGQRRRRRVVRG